MFRKLKRIVGFSPKSEWRCGRRWNIDLFKAMANETGSEIAQYRSGRKLWQRQCDFELQEFKFRCLKHLIETSSDENALTFFPPSFAHALNVKEKWINDETSGSEIKDVANAVARDTIGWWPSNWCFGINAMCCAKSVVLASLEREPPAATAARCAENLILHKSFTAACTQMNCRKFNESLPADNMCEVSDGRVVTRGVDCPHMENREIAALANNAIDSTALHWRNKLTEELTHLITPK
jgi:hypothetical protein